MPELKHYCVSISPLLHDKLDRHISTLKKLLRADLTKHDWVIAAINEKLERIDNEEIIKEKTLGLHLDPPTHERLGKHVEKNRQVQYSFSKNKWIQEAIQERLDQDAKQGN